MLQTGPLCYPDRQPLRTNMNCMVIALSCLGAGCVSAVAGQPATLTVSSGAFVQGRAIPSRHTGDGADVSPPLKWDGAPANAKSFALICDDPDAPAGTWVHWVLYNLPADAVSLAEATPKSDALPNGAGQGWNSFHKIGYGGPRPAGGRRPPLLLQSVCARRPAFPPGPSHKGRTSQGHVGPHPRPGRIDGNLPAPMK